MMRTRGHCPASMTTTRAAGPRTCSQLSSTISSSRSGQRPHHARHRVRGILFRDAQRLGDGRGNERGIGEGGQLDQPRAVLEAVGGQRSRPQGEPGLAAPARAGQRHHAGGAQAVQDRGELRPASHQRAHLRGQAGVPLDPAFGHDHPPGRASSMTRSAGIYPVRQMLTAAGETHAPSQWRITLI